MKAIICVFGNRSHRCFNRWHRLAAVQTKSMGKVAHLWKNEGLASLRELLYKSAKKERKKRAQKKRAPLRELLYKSAKKNKSAFPWESFDLHWVRFNLSLITLNSQLNSWKLFHETDTAYSRKKFIKSSPLPKKIYKFWRVKLFWNYVKHLAQENVKSTITLKSKGFPQRKTPQYRY